MQRKLSADVFLLEDIFQIPIMVNIEHMHDSLVLQGILHRNYEQDCLDK